MGKKARSVRKLIIVSIIENHPLAARQLEQTLERAPNIRALPSDKLLSSETGAANLPIVVVVDKGACPSPLEALLRLIRSRLGESKILLVDRDLSCEESCSLLLQGVHGLLAYSDVDRRLVRAIQSVAQGHLWVPPRILEEYVRFSARLSEAKRNTGKDLTPREKEIVELLDRRMSNKEISSILKISESTVKFHLANIFAKLGVHDRHSALETASSSRSDSVQNLRSIGEHLGRKVAMVPRGGGDKPHPSISNPIKGAS